MVGADEPGPPGGLADLLVVGPVLGEVPGGVQPDGCRSGTGPAHRLPEGTQVNRLPELRNLVPGNGEQVDEQPRADAAGGGHPFAVETVQGGGERRTVARGRRLVAVAVPGQAPDVVAEHVSGDVLDIPARAGRGPRPLSGAEPVQQIDERSLLPGEQRPDVDGRSQPGGTGQRFTSWMVDDSPQGAQRSRRRYRRPRWCREHARPG